MSDSLSIFAYSAGYSDASSGDEARRPESASYMEGYREGLKALGRRGDPEPLFGLTAGAVSELES